MGVESCAQQSPAWVEALRDSGFCFVEAGQFAPCLVDAGTTTDWANFAGSWNELEPDAYLAQTGRHRRRRYAVFSADLGGTIRREPHQPHYQSLSYNTLQGDIERWFEPVREDIGVCTPLRSVLDLARRVFDAAAGEPGRWHMELHQFRIEASAEHLGEPTPEGIHRDGVDYVLVLLIDRHNIASGTTSIHHADGTELGSFTLTRPMDAALVDDRRVFHGVTAVTPLDPRLPAHRDVLVVTFRRPQA